MSSSATPCVDVDSHQSVLIVVILLFEQIIELRVFEFLRFVYVILESVLVQVQDVRELKFVVEQILYPHSHKSNTPVNQSIQ